MDKECRGFSEIHLYWITCLSCNKDFPVDSEDIGNNKNKDINPLGNIGYCLFCGSGHIRMIDQNEYFMVKKEKNKWN